jgi:zinc/manganese transport system substrate-binding protein
VLTPFEFMKANAEGTDPPADTVTSINNSINSKQAKILIYNVQTVTPITTNVQNEAKKQNIPVVPVSETMPSGKTYQTWMMDQLNILATALQQATGK